MIKYYVLIMLAAVASMMTLSAMFSQSNGSALAPLIMDTANSSRWSPDGDCDDENYFKFTLKEEYTLSIGGMLMDSPNAPKFEASGVVYDSSRGAYWVVFDSLWSIAKLTSDLTRNEENMLVASDQNDGGDDSGFEGNA